MHDIITIAEVKVDVVDGPLILQILDRAIIDNEQKLFTYINAHGINLAQRYDWFKEYLNNSEVTYADGQGIRLASLLLNMKIPPLVNLTRWSWKLLEHCRKNNYSVFILGATNDVLYKAVKKIKLTFPDLKIVGTHHGFFQKEGSESEKIVKKISTSKPNVLIVGMGMPLQEKWIKENSSKLEVNAIFNAGSCIDIIAGDKKVCPDWLSRLGFEWLFRLTQEPRRLFVRYIFGNPKFIYYIFTRRNRKI